MDINTVFVLGAGASREVGLPVGEELKTKISELLNIKYDYNGVISGDRLIARALETISKGEESSAGDFQEYMDEAWHIRDALHQAISIDNFIDNHKGNEKLAICGKLAIARSILNAERASHLYIDYGGRNRQLDYPVLDKTWYTSFFKLLTENCTKDDLEKRFKTVALVVFNYDRCIEQFLYNAIQNYYRIPASETADLIDNISIYHPYGCVGFLPWQHDKNSIEYGGNLDANQLIQASFGIKTFTEGTNPSASDIYMIRKYIEEAGRLVFLGFAFHKLNMQLLKPGKVSNSIHTKCYATTMDMSQSDQGCVRTLIRNLYGRKHLDIEMANATCNKFFSEYWRSLSF